MAGFNTTCGPSGDSRNSMNLTAPSWFGALASTPVFAGTMAVTLGYSSSTGKPDALDAKPKKSITMPNPVEPELTASGTPKLRSVTVFMLPEIHFQVAQPLSQPSPCSTVSTVKWVVPEREGEDMATWPLYSARFRSSHSLATGRSLALT